MTMFNNAYGAGKRAGLTPPSIQTIGEFRYVIAPQCPYPAGAFIAWALWHTGEYIGTMERMNRKKGF